jgi:hypothetical protein
VGDGSRTTLVPIPTRSPKMLMFTDSRHSNSTRLVTLFYKPPASTPTPTPPRSQHPWTSAQRIITFSPFTTPSANQSTRPTTMINTLRSSSRRLKIWRNRHTIRWSNFSLLSMRILYLPQSYRPIPNSYPTSKYIESHNHDRHKLTAVSFRTTMSLRQDARVAAQPQPCVSPALCQGHADIPECTDSLGTFIIFAHIVLISYFVVIDRRGVRRK